MNSLNKNIEGKLVLLEDGKVILCEGGFGCYDFTIGSSICGRLRPDGERIKACGHYVVKILAE